MYKLFVNEKVIEIGDYNYLKSVLLSEVSSLIINGFEIIDFSKNVTVVRDEKNYTIIFKMVKEN